MKSIEEKISNDLYTNRGSSKKGNKKRMNNIYNGNHKLLVKHSTQHDKWEYIHVKDKKYQYNSNV